MWRFPLVRVLPFFVVGLLAGRFLPGGVAALLLLTTPLFLTGLKRSLRPFTLVAGVAIVFGWADVRLQDDRRFDSHYLHADHKAPHRFSGTVEQRLRPSARFSRLVVSVSSLDQRTARGKMLVNLPVDSSEGLLPGDRLTFTGKLHLPGPPSAPSDFDYGRYLAAKSLYASVYIRTGEWRRFPPQSPSFARSIALLQQRLEWAFREHGMGETELQVLMALVLGKQLDIPKDTLTDYQYAGAVHILSVSGLHVGLLLGFVLFCLRPLPATTRWNIFRFVFVLVFLWGFACVAGLSPSVVRSATMFSFVAGGTLLRKDGNLLHTLFVSMLVILIVSPSFLYDAGFQLSYLSLFFIVWLQPFFDRIAPSNNRLARYVWGLLAVSISAQLGVLPLSLYYFHQFPGLFFLTNLLVLPVLGIVMGAGFLAMLLATVGVLPAWLTFLVDRLLWAMNYVIHRIADIEGMVVRDVPFPISLLVVAYIALIALSAALRSPRFVTICNCAVGVLLVQATVLFLKLGYRDRDVLYVTHKSRASGILKVLEQKGEWISLIECEPRAGLKATLALNDLKVRPWQNCWYAAGQRILAIDTSGVYAGQPDVVVVTGSPRIHFGKMLREMHPKVVVADGSNYKSDIARWRATCHKMKIPFHATAEKGFYCVK